MTTIRVEYGDLVIEVEDEVPSEALEMFEDREEKALREWREDDDAGRYTQ